MKTLKVLMMLVTVMITSQAFAGREGGGGNVVICSNPATGEKTYQLLDFFEAPLLYGKKISSPVVSKDYMLIVQKVVEKLEKSVGEKPQVEPNHFTSWTSLAVQINANHVNETKKMVPSIADLVPINDSHSPIKPKGCIIKQAVAYLGKDEIYFDQNIWNRLDPLNKAGLILHEAIYAIQRFDGDSDSRRSRRLVAYLFSKTDFKNIYEGMPEKRLTCFGVPDDGSNDYEGTLFHIFEKNNCDKNGGSCLEFRFTQIAGRYVVSKKTASSSDLLDGKSKYFALGTQSDFESGDYMEMNGGEKNAYGDIIFKITKGYQSMSDGRKIKPTTIRCR